MSTTKRIVLRFPVPEATPRMFVATFDKSGISIHDVDNDVRIAKGIMKDKIPSLRTMAEVMFEGFDWRGFSNWVGSRDEFTPPPRDYDVGNPDCKLPYPGNPMMQMVFMPMKVDWMDARTPEMIARDADEKDPIKFPPASVEDMMMAIEAHPKLLVPSDGRSRLSWTIPLDNLAVTDDDLDVSFDSKWAEYVRDEEVRSDILDRVANRLGLTDDFTMDDDGVVTLDSFKDMDASFGSVIELRDMLSGMKQEEVVALYATVREADLNFRAVPEMVQDIAVSLRTDWEAEQDTPCGLDI